MKLLAIDTACECCSAALWVDGKLYHRSTQQPRLHAELILPFIEELLAESQINKKDIQGLIVGQGPGAFTGVRIGVAIAQGLALALGIKVVAVSNLQTLAFAAYQQLKTSDKKTIAVATDARMNEVYSAQFIIQKKHIQLHSPESVGKAEKTNLANIDAYVGNGFSTYPYLIDYANHNPMPYPFEIYSQAKDMLMMVKDDFNKLARDIETIEPIYLREP